MDAVIACLFFRPHRYLMTRLLSRPISPYKLKGKMRKLLNNKTYKNETNSEFAKRIVKLNDNCSIDTRNDIRTNLSLVYDYINDRVDNNKLVDRKSKTGTTLPRRLRNLRESLGECKLATFEDFTGTNQREANEFLKFILALFPDDAPNEEETIYYTNDLDTEIRNEKDIKRLKGTTCPVKVEKTGDIYFFVSPSDISTAPAECYLSSFLSVKDDIRTGDGEGPWVCDNGKISLDKKFNRRIKFNNCIESRYLVFDLLRAMKFNGGGDSSNNNNSNTEIFLDNKITPNETITLNNGNEFRFVSSVIRTKGMGSAHFTSFVLMEDIWYYYDDLVKVLDIVGNYKKLLEYNGGLVKDSVMYFYEPK